MLARRVVFVQCIARWLCALWVVAWSPVAAAEAPAEASSAEAAPSGTHDPAIPRDAASVVSGLAQLGEQSDVLDRSLSTLGNVESRRAALAREQDLLDAFADYLQRFSNEGFFRGRLLTLHNRLIGARARLDDLMERIAVDLEVIHSMESRWKQRQRGWSRSEIRTFLDPDERSELAVSAQRARDLIGEALERFARARQEVVALQERALDLHTRSTHLLELLESELARGRDTRLRRDERPLWTVEASAALLESEFSRTRERVVWWDRGFLGRSRLVLLIHGSLVVFFVVLARLFRNEATPATALYDDLWRHPFALALFASTALVGAAYQPAPPIVEALIWALQGATEALLAARALPVGARRHVGVAMATLYPVLAIVETLGIPAPVLRCVVVLVGLLGAATVWWWRRSIADIGRQWGWRAPLGIAIVAMIVGALAETAGFVSLGRYLLGSTARSGHIALTIVLLIALVRRLVDGVLRWSAAKVSARWRGVVHHFGTRTAWFVAVALAVQGGLAVLNTWELTPPPNEAWSIIGSYAIELAGVHLSVANVGLAALSIYLARQVSVVIELVLDATLLERPEFDAGIANSIKTLVRYVLIGVGVLVALGLVGIELRNIAIVAGALGIGIGFGLQSVVADLTSGLILLLERPLRTGDTVVIAGHWGVVKQIGLRSTVMRLIDESEMVIPNSHMTTEKVQNFTLSSRAARLFVPVGVAFGSDLELVFKTLEEVALRDDDVLVEPPPEVLFIAYGDSALKLELRVWIRRAETRFVVRSRLLRGIDRAFHEHKIKVAYPQQDLHVRSFDRDALVRIARTPHRAGDEPSSDPGKPPGSLGPGA